MKSLLLTLGHNSSAILIDDGELKWGYENERISGIKSDSRFPVEAMKFMGSAKPDMVYATHWAPDGKLSSMGSKYWDASYFNACPIRTLTGDVTHHDTHIATAVCYAGKSFPYGPKTFGLVIDGFGTFGEHLSIYNLSTSTPKLVSRVHGYGTSLGLWYQYATAFMGMKMHEDEYKLLGYEVKVDRSISDQLQADAQVYAAEWLEQMNKSIYGSKYDPMYDLSALSNVKDKIFSHLNELCKKYKITNPGDSRSTIAFYVQEVLQQVVSTIVRDLDATNLICSGGVFYNVKLNKVLLDQIDGQICICPLAGDQGNAIGLYAMDNPEFVFPKDLNWGARNLRDMGYVQNLVVVDEASALHLVRQRLDHVGFVNLVRGGMEFGPRAMCNTSTLSKPLQGNVAAINLMNDRNTVMPMAPCVTYSQYKSMFEKTDQVWRSSDHMVIAMEYKEHPLPSQIGIAHAYDIPYKHHTGRPQVVHSQDYVMNTLLNEYGPLINTSFNYHGKPIAFDMPSIIDNHMMQFRRNPAIFTVVIKND